MPLPETLAYCRNLRRLIDDLGLQSWTDLDRDVRVLLGDGLRRGVARWRGRAEPRGPDEQVGRPRAVQRDEVGDAEGARRIHAARQAAEQLLSPMIRGVQLTARTTTGSLGFRPFAGGDALDGAG